MIRHPLSGASRASGSPSRLLASAAALLALTACTAPTEYDVVLRNGIVYDGSGSPGVRADLAIQGDRIAAIGPLTGATGRTEIDVEGLAVAPGFINMMCWANESLIEDGRSQSDIRQGVTLEVMGEGDSMGPLNDSMKAEMVRHQADITYDIEWTTLGEYLEYLERRGVSPNVASFIGAAPPASTSSATKIALPRRASSIACGPSSARPWRKAPSVWPRR